MKLHATEITSYTDDLDRAVDFYSRMLGFTVLKRYEWGFALLDGRGTQIGLMDRSLALPDLGEHPAPHLAVQSANLAADLETLRRAGHQVGKVNGEAPGPRAAIVRDPDNNALFLWEDSSLPFPRTPDGATAERKGR